TSMLFPLLMNGNESSDRGREPSLHVQGTPSEDLSIPRGRREWRLHSFDTHSVEVGIQEKAWPQTCATNSSHHIETAGVCLFKAGSDAFSFQQRQQVFGNSSFASSTRDESWIYRFDLDE